MTILHAGDDGTGGIRAADSSVELVVTRPATHLSVAVVGLGYVGLPTAMALSLAGAKVIGLDVDPGRLQRILAGAVDLPPAQQQKLTLALQGAVELTTDAGLLARAHTVIVCVPTPIDSHLTPDLEALRAACAAVVAHAQPGQTLVLTSTTHVGATRELLVEPLEVRGFVVGHDIHVAFSPERIDPGSLGHDAAGVPRVVGGVTPACTEHAAWALSMVASDIHRVSSPEAAELTKLLENTFRAVNIALVNEIADVATAMDLDVLEVIDAAATKPYGFMRFNPGPGVGGHCIPCDPHYLLWQLRSMRHEAPLVEQAMRSIASRPGRVVQRARELLADAGRPIREARVVLVGVAYKPGVEDVRESPATEIAAALIALGAHVSFTDPYVQRMDLRDGSILVSVEPGTETYDLAIIHTRHPGESIDWLGDVPLVLDAAYMVHDLPDATRL